MAAAGADVLICVQAAEVVVLSERCVGRSISIRLCFTGCFTLWRLRHAESYRAYCLMMMGGVAQARVTWPAFPLDQIRTRMLRDTRFIFRAACRAVAVLMLNCPLVRQKRHLADVVHR